MRTRRTLISTLLLALCCFGAAGCEYVLFDLATLEYQPQPDSGDADASDTGPSDAGDVGDVTIDVGDAGDTGPDIGPDAGDVGDVGPDMGDVGDVGDGGDGGEVGPPGPVCTREFPLDSQWCNPVTNDPCPSAAQCKIVAVSLPPDVRVELRCSNPNEGMGDTGTVCTSAKNDCLNGLECVLWGLEPDPRSKECTAYCELQSGDGCQANEFCSVAKALAQEIMPGLGFCVPRCDPYDAEACGAGATCSVDYNYPEKTCLPEFRCVKTAGDPPVAEGGSCVADDVSQMCERGLVCLDGTCVKPCQGDADCGTGSCGAPATDFQLRYCQ